MKFINTLGLMVLLASPIYSKDIKQVYWTSRNEVRNYQQIQDKIDEMNKLGYVISAISTNSYNDNRIFIIFTKVD